MAFIGMRHIVACEIYTHTAGADPTYKSNAGFVVGKAIEGNLTINRNNNPLYADDAIAEDDNSITSMELEIRMDDLLEDVQDKMGLLKAVESSETSGGTTSTVTTYYENTAPAKDLGLGYIRVRRKDGATVYQGVWIYKAKFSVNSENSATRGESIEWQTPTAQGRCAGLSVDSTGEMTFRKKRNFSSETAAIAWLDGLANVPSA